MADTLIVTAAVLLAPVWRWLMNDSRYWEVEVVRRSLYWKVSLGVARAYWSPLSGFQLALNVRNNV